MTNQSARPSAPHDRGYSMNRKTITGIIVAVLLLPVALDAAGSQRRVLVAVKAQLSCFRRRASSLVRARLRRRFRARQFPVPCHRPSLCGA